MGICYYYEFYMSTRGDRNRVEHEINLTTQTMEIPLHAKSVEVSITRTEDGRYEKDTACSHEYYQYLQYWTQMELSEG